MYFNKKGMQISQIELKIEELQENLKKNQTWDLKLRYIELLKQREALYCNASRAGCEIIDTNLGYLERNTLIIENADL